MERRSFGVAGEKRNRWFQIFHQFSFHRKGREYGRGCVKIKPGEPIRRNWCGKIYLFYNPGKRNSVSLYIFTQPLEW